MKPSEFEIEVSHKMEMLDLQHFNRLPSRRKQTFSLNVGLLKSKHGTEDTVVVLRMAVARKNEKHSTNVTLDAVDEDGNAHFTDPAIAAE